MGKGKKVQDTGERRTIRKATLGTPFKNCWPDVEKNVSRRIMEEIKREMPERLTKENPSRKTKGKINASDDQASKIEGQVKLYYKDYLVIGINQVTKALEKRPLLLVMVCKSAKPISMTNHLMPLCAMQDTQGCCLSGVNETLSSVFGLTSVLAVGFKVKENHPLADLIAFIKDKIPPLDVPWVDVWKKESRISLSGSGSLQENTEKAGTEENADFQMLGTSENDTGSEKNAIDNELNMDLCESKTKHEDSNKKEDEITIVDIDSRIKGNEKEISSYIEANTDVKNKNKLVDDKITAITVSSKTENRFAKEEMGMNFDDSSTRDKSSKTTLKREFDNVGYTLIDTNFKMIEVVVPQKKQSVKK